jgi:uncharacterized glyoxalase superfamily metalloenzyme YdcJ
VDVREDGETSTGLAVAREGESEQRASALRRSLAEREVSHQNTEV